ncbi:hypothetical protein HPG69_019736 [Diceros bicornis minor]|uniref:Uncharacterized protein n=1 Tax=Diceros bicornis minor TaxID=77932 RepID=A0A7J7EYU6_DICBM|nr:hypothetical protein HPG69_019736 [Diceros bicornis minor]
MRSARSQRALSPLSVQPLPLSAACLQVFVSVPSTLLG